MEEKIEKNNSQIGNKECPIEEVFSSKGRVLILKILAKKNELNISAIAKQTNQNHTTASKHLKFLNQIGLIQKKKFGRIKIFRYRLEDYRARAIKRLFNVWEKNKEN